MTPGTITSSDTGVKSRSVLYGRFFSTNGLTTCGVRSVPMV